MDRCGVAGLLDLRKPKASRSAGNVYGAPRRKRKIEENDEAGVDEGVVPERRGNGLSTSGKHGDEEG